MSKVVFTARSSASVDAAPPRWKRRFATTNNASKPTRTKLRRLPERTRDGVMASARATRKPSYDDVPRQIPKKSSNPPKLGKPFDKHKGNGEDKPESKERLNAVLPSIS